LVQAAANVRIQNKTKLCEQETIKRACRQWLRLNQQKIVTNTTVPGPPKPEDAHKSYSWYEVGPETLAGEYLIEPEGGATQAANPAEKMQEAQGLLMMLGQNPLVDQRALLELVLQKTGVANPHRLLAQQVQLGEQGITLLAQGLEQIAGIPAQQTMMLAQEAIQLEQQQKQQEGQQPSPVPSAEPPTMG
jgi:hypothetical protein